MTGSGSHSPDHVTLPVALVVPVKNEVRTLPELFTALAQAPAWPAEFVFADAGSTDGTQELLRSWWRASARTGTRFEIVERPGAFPGGGRNAAIAAASAEWIAFLDGGIRPEVDWLEQLHACAVAGGRDHAFGLCRFDGAPVIPLAVCALTNGVGRMRTVLPASMFHRRVFERIGMFPEHLRSAEDLIWLGRFEEAFGPRLECARALVHYTHYPATLGAILRKWFAFEKSSVAAGVGALVRAVYVLGALVWVLLTLLAPQLALAAVVAYVLLRGVIDPIRRSRAVRWWRGAPAAALLAPVCAFCIDAGKLVGALAGLAPPAPIRGV